VWLPQEQTVRENRWRTFDRIFADGSQQVRYIREIIFGKRRAVQYWLITTDPDKLPTNSTWYVMTKIPGVKYKMAKLSHTSQTAIAITFLVMNLSTWLRRVFCAFLCLEPKTTSFHLLLISKNYIYKFFKQYQLISATALNQSLIFLLRSRTYSASPN
jgi:hypothetical protein